MKRIIIICLTLLFMFTLVACSKKEIVTEETTIEATEQATQETTDKQWPENELTNLVPKPDFGVLNGAVEIENEFFVSINDSELIEVREYVEIVKQLGFTENPDTIDKEAIGIEVFSYSAETIEGYKISIEYTAKVCSITLSKLMS